MVPQPKTVEHHLGSVLRSAAFGRGPSWCETSRPVPDRTHLTQRCVLANAASTRSPSASAVSSLRTNSSIGKLPGPRRFRRDPASDSTMPELTIPRSSSSACHVSQAAVSPTARATWSSPGLRSRRAGHGTAVVGNRDGKPSLPVHEHPKTGSSFSDSKPNTSTEKSSGRSAGPKRSAKDARDRSTKVSLPIRLCPCDRVAASCAPTGSIKVGIGGHVHRVRPVAKPIQQSSPQARAAGTGPWPRLFLSAHSNRLALREPRSRRVNPLSDTRKVDARRACEMGGDPRRGTGGDVTAILADLNAGRERFELVDESAFIEVVLLRRAGHPRPDHHGRAAVHPTALPTPSRSSLGF